MRLRDLLTFNLFLQLTDGVISYQAFCAWGSRSQSCSSRCNLKLGNDLGTNLQQSLGVPAAAPDICSRTQSRLTGNAGIERDGLVVRVRHYCVSLGTPAVRTGSLRPFKNKLDRMEPELIFRALSHLLIVFLSLVLVVLSDDTGPE